MSTALQRCVDAIRDETRLGPAERSFGKHRGVSIATDFEWDIPFTVPKHRAEGDAR